MIDELRAMAVFAKTVESGSFRSAAKALDLSPSVVSHHVSQLEERLGVALLYRSTRKLSLTHEGQQLFESAKAMLAAAEMGLNGVASRSSEPIGRLNLTLPAVLTRSVLIKSIAAFANAFPKVSLSINVSDHPQDLIRDGIDLAIRIGGLKDSTLKAKKLFRMERKLVMAPAYGKNRKSPRHPKDLNDWDWVHLKMRPTHKVLINPKGDRYQIDYDPRITVDSVDAVCQLAVEGIGLASPPSFLVEKDIKAGRLVELLPKWSIESLDVYAVWPPNASRESLTARMIQFLKRQKHDTI